MDGKRIQVKTQFPHDVIVENVDCLSSPTVSKGTFSHVDYIILVIIQDEEIPTAEFYVFDRDDFQYFGEVGCWTGKKGDRTIFLIKKVKGELTPSAKKIVSHYNNSTYKKLFKRSQDWRKIQ